MENIENIQKENKKNTVKDRDKKHLLKQISSFACIRGMPVTSPVIEVIIPGEACHQKFVNTNKKTSGIATNLLKSGNTLSSFIYNTNKNCCILSSDKDSYFELAILKVFNGQFWHPNQKILYLGPTENACQERLEEWTTRFKKYEVGLLKGNINSMVHTIRTSNIILACPSDWDRIFRGRNDISKIFPFVQLFLVEQLHRLENFPIMETFVTRMKNLSLTSYKELRIIANTSNLSKIPQWLGEEFTVLRDDTSKTRSNTISIVPYKSSGNMFHFNSFLTRKLDTIIQEYASNSTIIYCATRSMLSQTARHLYSLYLEVSNFGEVGKVSDPDLRVLVSRGVAFHHAALSISDRQFIEFWFKAGKIKVICTTSVHINIPADLGIIKGSQCWNGSTFTDFSKDCLQRMAEKKLKCILLTTIQEQHKFETILQDELEIKSSLQKKLNEYLLCEIIFSSLNTIDLCSNWLAKTYYTLNDGCEILVPLYSLMEKNLIHIDDEKNISPTFYGLLAIKNNLSISTIFQFMNCKEKNSIDDILFLISNSDHFETFALKHHERKLFSHQGEAKEKLKTFHKITLLLKFEAQKKLTELPANIEKERKAILTEGLNLLISLREIFIKNKDSTSLRSTIQVILFLTNKCWEDSIFNPWLTDESIRIFNKKISLHSSKCLK